MRYYISVPMAIIAFSCVVTHSQEAAPIRDGRIQAAVSAIVAVQFGDGESAAISALQACYQSLPQGKNTERLEECLSQDIAYANLSAGMYAKVLKNMKQPEYASIDAMKVRVFNEARRAGHSQVEAGELLRGIAPLAIQSIGPAIQARQK